MKVNLYPALTEFPKMPPPPLKKARSVISSVISFHSGSKYSRMITDSISIDSTFFVRENHLKSYRTFRGIFKRLYLVNSLLNYGHLRTPRWTCLLYVQSSSSNVFDHITTTCPETSQFRNAMVTSPYE